MNLWQRYLQWVDEHPGPEWFRGRRIGRSLAVAYGLLGSLCLSAAVLIAATLGTEGMAGILTFSGVGVAFFGFVPFWPRWMERSERRRLERIARRERKG